MSIVVDSQMLQTASQVGQLVKQQCGLTQKQISRLKFQENGIIKNGMKCRVTEPIHIGDVIRICIEETRTDSAHIQGTAGDLDILYEDLDLLIVNKPAGMVTHPQGMHYQDTLVNRVQSYFQKKGENYCIRPVGRLDKETSGIVVFAKNRVAASNLQWQREQGIFQKRYLAYVRGQMEVSEQIHTICRNIGVDPQDSRKMIVDERGKYACTHYRVVDSWNQCSMIELWLETGRTHQIRVHMASCGYPLLGDQLYGMNGQEKFYRAALHAEKVKLKHPVTGKWLEVKAELPEDMKQVMRGRR